MTNLLQFHQGLLLDTILFKVILRSIDDFLDDLFVDLALQTCQYRSLAGSPRTMCQLPLDEGPQTVMVFDMTAITIRPSPVASLDR